MLGAFTLSGESGSTSITTRDNHGQFKLTLNIYTEQEASLSIQTQEELTLELENQLEVELS